MTAATAPLPARRPCALPIAALVLAMSACRPAVRIDNASPFEEDDPEAAQAFASTGTDLSGTGASETGAAAAPAPASAPPRTRLRLRTMQVERRVLHEVLDRGPGSFLHGIEVKAHFRGDDFDGWEIVQFMPGETRFDPYDLRPGDVIGPVNGHRLARPRQLADLWSELRTAESIVIEVARPGGAFQLRFEVSDDAKSSTP